MKPAKNLFCFLLVLSLSLSLTLPALADTEIPLALTGPSAIYQCAEAEAGPDILYTVNGVPDGVTIDASDVSLTNPGTLVTVYAQTNVESFGYYRPGEYVRTGEIALRGRVPGNVTMTVKVGDRTLTKEISVLSYVRPIKYFSITGVSSAKNLASKFKKKYQVTGSKLTKTVSSGRFKVKAASGWIITEMWIASPTADIYSMNQQKYMNFNTTTGTLKFASLKKKTPYTFYVTCENIANRGTITVMYEMRREEKIKRNNKRREQKKIKENRKKIEKEEKNKK